MKEQREADSGEASQNVNVCLVVDVHCQNPADYVSQTELNRGVRIGLFERLKNEVLVPWLKEGQLERPACWKQHCDHFQSTRAPWCLPQTPLSGISHTQKTKAVCLSV